MNATLVALWKIARKEDARQARIPLGRHGLSTPRDWGSHGGYQ
jgi:hypothetical protein